MLRIHFAGMTAAIIASALAATAQAQQPAPPPFATTKVTDNVYIFRYGNHQSMFIVTPAGVIATDPISERRPVKPYIDAIQAVTKAPIKYVIYSHSHFDHIAGGKPFKDLARPLWHTETPRPESPRLSPMTWSSPIRLSTARGT
jgi:glyoxylase-like metal-dependent hydrolase (beta-lactamase superfamily II)